MMVLLSVLLACTDPEPEVFRTTSGATAYDADNDGFADVGILKRPDTASGGGGSFELFYGSPGGLQQSVFTSFPISRSFGQAYWVGDLNGDGYADAAVTSDYTGESPSVSIAYGGPRGSSSTAQVTCNQGLAPDGERGAYTGRAGDLDGDGFDDLVVGAGGGRLCVWAGRSEALSGDPDVFEQAVENNGPATNALKRWSGLGDVDGDGLSDVAVGGVIRRGGSGLLTEQSLEMPTFPHPGSIDLNGDGHVDLVTPGSVVLQVWMGVEGGFASSAIEHTLDPELPVLTAESELAHLGDIDGDGMHDAALSVPFRDQGGLDSATDGMLSLFYGGEDGLRQGTPEGMGVAPAAEFLPSAEAVELNGFRIGFAIGVGDINGDGVGDVGVEIAGGGLAWIYGSTRRIEGPDLEGYVIVNRASPRMASTASGVLPN